MKSNGEILITSHRQIGGSFPERITNEKFMFIIHKPAAYASAISLYISSMLLNIAKVTDVILTIFPWPEFHDFERMHGIKNTKNKSHEKLNIN